MDIKETTYKIFMYMTYKKKTLRYIINEYLFIISDYHVSGRKIIFNCDLFFCLRQFSSFFITDVIKV